MPTVGSLPERRQHAGLCVRPATPQDRRQIYRQRHRVYAEELGQHHVNGRGELSDALDEFNDYVVVAREETVVGFLSITPPGQSAYSLDKYLQREDWPFPVDAGLYELRLLTVVAAERNGPGALLLMHAARRYLQEHGATRVMAIGRSEILDLYLRIGLRRLGREFASGAVKYELMTATLDEVARCTAEFEPLIRRMESRTNWQMDIPYSVSDSPATQLPVSERSRTCYHGGAFFSAIGDGFEALDRRTEVINSDVLDAWFPPAPAVLDELGIHLEWILRTSPPTHCQGLIREISSARCVPEQCLLPGAGSSDLIYRSIPHLVKQGSRVLLLDPTYGEYQHFFDHVMPCEVERLILHPEDGFVVGVDEIEKALRNAYDLVVLVNPNNPTGMHIPRERLEGLLEGAPASTRFWIDEAYVDFVSPTESLEQFAVTTDNVVVCKSMSKAYALSGARVGYLCGPHRLIDEFRAKTPPWVVSLPAQVAGVLALRDPDYYQARYMDTRRLKTALAGNLQKLGFDVWPGAANFLLCRIPPHMGDAASLIDRCRRKGLFLRDVSSMTARRWDRMLRVAVKDCATNERMIEILRHQIEDVRQPGRRFAGASSSGGE
ncbi:MAG: histidinol-phosphate aminotransferase family protein [Planctomycetota bacterium]|nr:MAG: histidinol-phosphate aminotransferase family protein [Planctomycetota bacterium]